MIDLTIVTATCDRPALLALCLDQIYRQSLGTLNCELIIVSDGPDPVAQGQAARAGARYAELPARRGHAGAFCKDLGLALATGRYVCFWDDDNLYQPHALATLYSAAFGCDLGVVRARHRLRKGRGEVTIPRRWSGTFEFGDVDTMCVCVKTSLARQEFWGDEDGSAGTDYRWLMKLMRHEPEIRFVPIVIGTHL